jgi:hypothetical protein
MNRFDIDSVDVDYMIECLDKRFDLLSDDIRDDFKNGFVDFYISSVEMID